MKKLLLLAVFLVMIPVEMDAQVSFRANMTDSRLARLAKAKDARTKMKRYRKMYHRDSVSSMKTQQKALIDSLGRKKYKEYRDSVTNWHNYKGHINQIIAQDQSLRKFKDFSDKCPEREKIKKFRLEQKMLSDSLGKEGYQQYQDSLKQYVPWYSEMIAQSDEFQQDQKLGNFLPKIPDFADLDSLKGTISEDSLKNLKRQYRMEYLKLDSVRRPELPDSLKNLEFLAKYGMYGEMMDIYGIGKNIPRDSAEWVQQVMREEMVRSFLPEELQNDMKFAEFKQQFAASDTNKEDPTGSLLQSLPSEQIGTATQLMSVLRKGYISVPNSNDLSSAKKRTSLRGVGTVRRLHLGGNVAVQSFNPVILDADIQLGYRLNRKFTIGTGFVMREQFDEQPSALTGDGWGNTLFLSHALPLDIFGYVEYKRIKSRSLFEVDFFSGLWQQEFNAGIGKEVPVTRWLNMTALLLYDFNFKRNDLHSRPFQVRFGYHISEWVFRKK